MKFNSQLLKFCFFGMPEGFVIKLNLQDDGGCIPPHRKYLDRIVPVKILNNMPYVMLEGRTYPVNLISLDPTETNRLVPLHENEMVLLKDVHTWSEFMVIRLSEIRDN